MWSLKSYRQKLRQQRWNNEYLSGKWKVESGKWKVESGKWKVESGKWNYMQSIEELGRYSIIIGYVQYLKVKTILDVGCGDGNLIPLLPLIDAYVGIDISRIALDKAQEKMDVGTNYCLIEADFDEYSPTNKFDLIVFSESVYYSKHPLETLVSYQNALVDGGHCVISMYKNLRAPPVWDMVIEIFDIVDETHIQQKNQGWISRLLIPKQK